MICRNPQAAERDKHIREQLVAQLQQLIDGTDPLSDFKRGEPHGKIAGRPGLNRHSDTCREAPPRYREIKAEENIDGE
ncbi:hypothetical protein ABGB08_32220 [Acrocarpospora sp. B8E8]